MTCKHDRGDYVSTYWLCADCFAKLEQRPIRYRMVQGSALQTFTNIGDKSWTSPMPRQQIAWKADIATSKEGVTFSKFIGYIAERFVRRGRLEKQEAIDMAIEALKALAELGDTFGCSDFSWDKDAAYEIADQEMSYWDSDGDGSNS